MSDGVTRRCTSKLPDRPEPKLLEAIGPVPAAVQKLIETLAREAWQIAVAPVRKVGDEELAVTADDWHHLSIEVMHQPLHALKQLPPLAMPWPL